MGDPLAPDRFALHRRHRRRPPAHPVDCDIDNNSRPLGAGIDMGCREVPAISPGTYYVDIVNGADATANGSASGAGAWKTLHYALDLVNAGSPGAYAINVAQGMYTVANGEADEELSISQDQVSHTGRNQRGDRRFRQRGMVERPRGHRQDAVIENLEIRNFSNCGIKVQDSSPLIEKNVLLDNVGCGVEVDALASPTNPDIRNNLYRTGVASATGVRIGAMYDCSPMIYHNTILGEQAKARATESTSPLREAEASRPRSPGTSSRNTRATGSTTTAGTPPAAPTSCGTIPSETTAANPCTRSNRTSTRPLFFSAATSSMARPPASTRSPFPTPPRRTRPPTTSKARPAPTDRPTISDATNWITPPPSRHLLRGHRAGHGRCFLGTGAGTEAWKTLHFAIVQINRGLAGVYKLVLAGRTYSIEAGEYDGGLTVLQDNLTIEGPAAGSPPSSTEPTPRTGTGESKTETDNTVFKNLSFRSFADEDVGFAPMGEAAIAVRSGSGTVVENCQIYENYEGIRLDPTATDRPSDPTAGSSAISSRASSWTEATATSFPAIRPPSTTTATRPIPPPARES